MDNVRSIRNEPFCWQAKEVYRTLRKHLSGTNLVKARCLYAALTEIDSDFKGKEIEYYTKTIHAYSGLSTQWIPEGLRLLESFGLLRTEEIRENGRFAGRKIILLGTVKKQPVEVEKPTRKKRNVEISEDVKQLTKKVQDLILQNFPAQAEKFEKDFEKHCAEIDKILRIDKYTHDDILAAAQFAANHRDKRFSWADQFRSPMKLRKESKSLEMKYIAIWLEKAKQQKTYTFNGETGRVSW